MQQHPAQTLAWDPSVLPLMPSRCVLLGSTMRCSVLQVCHNSAKAQRETEPFGLGLGWGCAVTPACHTIELRSALCLLLPKLWRCTAATHLATWGLSLAKGGGQSLHGGVAARLERAVIQFSRRPDPGVQVPNPAISQNLAKYPRIKHRALHMPGLVNRRRNPPATSCTTTLSPQARLGH